MLALLDVLLCYYLHFTAVILQLQPCVCVAIVVCDMCGAKEQRCGFVAGGARQNAKVATFLLDGTSPLLWLSEPGNREGI